MAAEFIAHSIFSFVSGISVAITGFGCDSTRELFAALSTGPKAFPPSSAINMGLSAALVTAVQATLDRRMINGGLLLNTLPLTFIGVMLSLNVFSVSFLAALVPPLGACLFGLSLMKLWMELADCRHKVSVREADDDERQGANSWKWTGVLAMASLAGGLLSARCPAPGPAFMVVLLAARGSALVGGGEWRATAALVTCSSSMLRVGLLLLENGASVGPLPEMLVLVLGGLVGVGAGNLSLRLVFSPGDVEAEQRRTPPPSAFRRCVLSVALVSSIALATGGPPAAVTAVARPVCLAALVVVCVVVVGGGLWGCTRGAEKGGARGAYGTVASDDRDVEVELKPFAVGNGSDARVDDDDFLDEEDGYLADEGETDLGNRRGVREQPDRPGGRRGGTLPSGSLSPRRRSGGQSDGAGVTAAKDEKKPRIEAPPAQSLFPAGHTMEL